MSFDHTTHFAGRSTCCDEPLVSVITVVLNAREEFRRTVESVLAQKYPAIEMVVIDGGSNDGTLDVIREYDRSIAFWVSEPDRGIYDAMNKGIAAATGDFLYFLNAGDTFYDPDVLTKVFAVPEVRTAPFIYGHVLLTPRDGSFSVLLGRKARLEDLARGMVICHQGLLVSREAVQAIGAFNAQYRCAADYDWVIRLVRAFPDGGVFVPVTIARMLMDGYSSTHFFTCLRERREIVRRQLPVEVYLRFLVGHYWRELLRAHGRAALIQCGALTTWRRIKGALQRVF